jgi:flagellar hook-associated protein 1 FlgK
MGIPNVFQTGRSGMVASKAAIATTGHNIANANTEGYSRQRVQTETATPQDQPGSKRVIGTGTKISRIERINDEYIEKQVRNGGRDMANFEEKDTMLKQVEDVFNEMNGDGLNRLVARFFNEFRKLSNEPENEAIRESVREASQSMASDFKRLRHELEDVRDHIDQRVEGYAREATMLAGQIKDLNNRIRAGELAGGAPNDLLDQRDQALKKLTTFADLAMHKDNHGNFIVDIKGVGPLIVGPQNESFSVQRSPADDQGKPENSFDLMTTASARSKITHQIKGGKFGALMEVRDQTLSTLIDRLDEMAFTITNAVNDIHEQGFNRYGQQGIAFFRNLDDKTRAAEYIGLSDEVLSNSNNIASAAQPDAPGDNRVAIAISGLQHQRLMNDGNATLDAFYNGIVSDVGVAASKNKFNMNQQRDIMAQLNKMRDQISGVSIDEETTNLMQYQHSFDASARVIKVADECMQTVLDLKK